jgi:sugar phosphate isomerase/epimerase
MATNYESFYSGGYSSLSPEFGDYFSGYRMNAGQLGFPGSPSTANQLGETVNALKQGVKAFEVSMLAIQGDPDQTIPKQHFKEMKALMKLSGVKPSVHGPIVDAAGFGQRGWDGDDARADNERRMFDALEKAYMIDDSGKIPVVLHSTNGIPGIEYAPDEKGGYKINKIPLINRETGQLVNPADEDFKFYPERPDMWGEKGIRQSPERNIEAINNGEWESKLTELATFNKHADEIIGSSAHFLGEYKNAWINKSTREIIDAKTGERMELKGEAEALYKKMKDADIFLDNAQLNFKGAFHKAYKFSDDEEQKEKLRKLAEDYSKKMGSIGSPDNNIVKVWAPIEKRAILDEAINELQEITSEKGPPKVFMNAEEFAIDKTIETFGSLAAKSYDKFGEKAPIIAIENMYQGMAYSRSEDLIKIVKSSRDKFADYLIKEKGMKKDEADRIAEEKIGATWDVGHLNIVKKKGFDDKHIVEETKKIRPYVRHIHLTDNFGYSDSHLPPGMGNVPIKEILKELEKNGRFGEMRKIVEAGNFVQHFKKSPHPLTLNAFGSPIYGMKTTSYWNQTQDFVGNYFGGYGTINPQQHHSLYGSGFTMLPAELGGNMPGGQGQSRFGGTPMA